MGRMRKRLIFGQQKVGIERCTARIGDLRFETRKGEEGTAKILVIFLPLRSRISDGLF